jgi:uncharacterized RDD family membrane protein YckC
MNTFRSTLFTSLLVALLPAFAITGFAAPAAAAETPDTSSTEAPSAADAPLTDDEPLRLEWHRHFGWRRHHGNDWVNFGQDTDLPSGQHADSVVSILGSSSSEGDAADVVSILGNTRVTGPVKESAVAILGNTYVDSAIDGDAVAVLGNVELGPSANIGGNVVALGGTVTRDPAAIIHGSVHSVAGHAGGFNWLRPWIEHCLFYGRPLALVPGIDWAWGLAFAFLALYVGLALLFRPGINQCVQTMEMQPGMTVLAALLTLLLTPVLVVLLCITVIGIPAVPFLVFALFCMGLFGKAVMLAWLGRRCTGVRTAGPLSHPAVAVLIGGAIVLALYLVPILGLVVFKLLGLLGLGVVVYTLILAARAHRAANGNTPHSPAAPSATPPPPPTPTPAVSVSPAVSAPDPGAPAPSASAAPGVTAASPRAGFWIRIAALLLDALLVGILMGAIYHRSHLELPVLAVYGAVMWKLRGSTIGGIVLDLRVVRLDGREIDWETAIIRALSCFLSLAVAGLGFFWIAFDGARQAWHDKIAGTVVVRVPKVLAPR